jgi:hypothetical protein
LLNVIDDPNAFSDTSSTALLASVTYRMATFTKDKTLIPSADNTLKLVKDSISEAGWVQNTVKSYTFYAPTAASGDHSAEGQAFVLLLHAAW